MDTKSFPRIYSTHSRMKFHPVIAAADIGSIKKPRFGWALLDPNRPGTSKGSSIVEFANTLLTEGRSIALGFECPLFVPMRQDPNELTSARDGEGNQAWCAGAGAGALATGLTEVGWVLREIRAGVKGEPKLTLRWEEFVSKGDLLLWGAFVSGKAKTNSHANDAERAVRAFNQSLPYLPSANRINEPTVMSLVGAAALWSGWSSDPSILSDSCLVISADAG